MGERSLASVSRRNPPNWGESAGQKSRKLVGDESGRYTHLESEGGRRQTKATGNVFGTGGRKTHRRKRNLGKEYAKKWGMEVTGTTAKPKGKVQEGLKVSGS